jgi:hypothetical protein
MFYHRFGNLDWSELLGPIVSTHFLVPVSLVLTITILFSRIIPIVFTPARDGTDAHQPAATRGGHRLDHLTGEGKLLKHTEALGVGSTTDLPPSEDSVQVGVPSHITYVIFI